MEISVPVFSSFFRISTILLVFYPRIGRVHCAALSFDNIGIGDAYDPTREYDFPTDWPININTSLVTSSVIVPVQFYLGTLERGIVRNSGKTVILKTNQTQTVDSAVFGGDTYRFEFARFYWVNKTDETARAATTVNNRGFPLELVIYYRNAKYGCFKKAIKHRDGLLAVELFFNVNAVLPNPLFPLFQQYLTQVKKAGTQVPALLIFLYAYFVANNPQLQYIYPGSYYDDDTGKTYYCATYITQDPILAGSISRSQFQSFLDLRDYNGNPLTRQDPLYPYRGQPIVKGIGEVVVPLV